jgi:hypothetical protein
MIERMQRGVGDWFAAVVASVAVGALVGVGCVGVIALCGYLSHVTFDMLRSASFAFAALAGGATAAHFLRLFALGEVEVRDIWKSIGKFLAAFGNEAPF